MLPLPLLLMNMELLYCLFRAPLRPLREVRLHCVPSRTDQHREHDGDGVHRHPSRVCLQPPPLRQTLAITDGNVIGTRAVAGGGDPAEAAEVSPVAN